MDTMTPREYARLAKVCAKEGKFLFNLSDGEVDYGVVDGKGVYYTINVASSYYALLVATMLEVTSKEDRRMYAFASRNWRLHHGSIRLP